MMPAANIPIHRRQRGIVLVTALIFLVILTLLGITSMSTNTLEERMAANSQDVHRAFQAAEAGLSMAFSGGAAFAGTTVGYEVTQLDSELGSYKADAGFTSKFKNSVDISGYQDIDTATSGGVFKWYFFDVVSSGDTESGASVRLGAGAKVLGQ